MSLVQLPYELVSYVVQHLGPGQGDGICDGLRQRVFRDGGCELRHVFISKLYLLSVALAVTKSSKLGVWSWKVDKTESRVEHN
jgi:hypothetical protein